MKFFAKSVAFFSLVKVIQRVVAAVKINKGRAYPNRDRGLGREGLSQADPFKVEDRKKLDQYREEI